MFLLHFACVQFFFSRQTLDCWIILSPHHWLKYAHALQSTVLVVTSVQKQKIGAKNNKTNTTKKQLKQF